MTLAPAAAQAGLSDVPTPTISGPLTVTASNYPFLATDQPLASYGYTEQEFTVTGLAYRYTGTSGQTTATKTVTGGPNGDGTYPFKTRIVVRRPVNAADFNGKTLLEWNNVTAGFDVEWNWMNDPQNLMRKGYAWVGVSAQAVGVNYLKTWNATRYGDLDVTSTAGSGDPLSYDIYGSIAKALKGGFSGTDPMGGLTTNQIIATGESQSGSRLNIYYNNIQPLHDLINSFLITVAGPASGTPLRSNLDSNKVIRLLSERENLTGPQTGTTNDPDTSNYRRWSVAGGSHLPFMAYANFATVGARDTGPGTADCVSRPLSRVPWPIVWNRALDDLTSWQNGGSAPANAPRLTYGGNQSLNNNAVSRDSDGLALGGIRLPDIEVPTAVNTAVNAASPGATGFSAFCSLLGSWTQFSSNTVNSRYTDYNDYLTKYAAKAQAAADAGFVTSADVTTLNNLAKEYTRVRPTAPALTAGAASNTGAFTLGWNGPPPTPQVTSAASATTYGLQRKSTAAGSSWQDVSGSTALSARSKAFTNADEGTYTYRVSGTSTIKALYPDPQVDETTPASDASPAVKVDRTGPNVPTATADRAPEYSGGGGWYKDTVTVTFTANGDPDLPDGTPGSGVDLTTLTAPQTFSTSGSATASGTVKDNLGNTSAAGTLGVQVDATAPTVSVTCPATLPLNGVRGAFAEVDAADGESGLTSLPPDGIDIDTSSVGTKTVQYTATDNVGHSTTESCQTEVVYTDDIAPAVQITQPLPGAVFPRGVVRNAQYSCSDKGDSGLKSCVGTVASGSPVDTSTAGTIAFTVTATDNAGNSSSTTVYYTVTASLPVNQSAPTVSGTPTLGQTLSVALGSWRSTGPNTYSVSWERSGDKGRGAYTAIAGATGRSYRLTRADVGSRVRAVVTVTNPDGSTSKASPPTDVVAGLPPVNTAAPTVTGTAQLRQVLTGARGTWTGAPGITYTYRWQRSDAAGGTFTDIPGSAAASLSYRAVAADVGRKLRFVVTATNTDGTLSVESAATATVTK